MVALLAPASPAAAELDNCGSGGGNALVYDERAGYGLDTISADINVHTGAVCNSDTSRGNVTYAYTSIDDKFAHYVNAGYRRYYGGPNLAASAYSYTDATGYKNRVLYFEGLTVGLYYTFEVQFDTGRNCFSMTVRRGSTLFIDMGCAPRPGWYAPGIWRARAGGSTAYVASDVAGSNTVPVASRNMTVCPALSNGTGCGSARINHTSVSSRYFIRNVGANYFDMGTR